VKRALLVAITCGALIAGSATSAGATSASAGTSALARTPYMGWNTYYGVGGIYNEGTILSVAKSLIKSGLAKAGYRIVWLDYGWASGARTSTGQIVLNPGQWPHGMAWLTAWLHAHGLLAGIYTDAGRSGCFGDGLGSYGHYQQDADQFAAWGFDAVKVDFCGAGQQGYAPRPLYKQFATAIRDNASHRPMILNVCNFWTPGQIKHGRPTYENSSFANSSWAPALAQSWRTDTDIGGTGKILFKNVLRNLDADAAHPKAAGPGHWNDPDYLGPQLGMTATESQAQLTMWSMVAAPLILGSDPRKLSAGTIRMLRNPRVLAVDQDRLGIQGTEIFSQGHGQVWVKPLSGGRRAVALLNTGPRAGRITTTAGAIGITRAGRYSVQNLWNGRSSVSTGTISAVVAPDSVLLYEVARD
jgi:alpha-galactosidase